MSKTYRADTASHSSPRASRPQLEAELDLDMIDYLDEMEFDRREAEMEFAGVQPTLSVDAYLH